MIAPELSVCIATRNRPALLARCLASLTWLGERAVEVLVIDDASELPVEPVTTCPYPLRVIRHPTPTGYIVARNELARLAAAPVILTLDDDAELINPRIAEGLAVLAADPAVGAVAFPQIHENGDRYPLSMQPAPVDYPCLVPTFYGYAHLVRRELFRRLGGYRERFHAFGEEMEFCKRLWDAGAKVVYLPGVAVRHLHSPTQRSDRARLRYSCRNALLGALYNEPFPLPLLSIPARLVSFVRWGAREGHLRQLGLGWQLKELAVNLLPTLCERRPLRWRTLRLWNRLKATWPAYRQP